jgi:hypothetical protein
VAATTSWTKPLVVTRASRSISRSSRFLRLFAMRAPPRKVPPLDPAHKGARAVAPAGIDLTIAAAAQGR